MTSVLQEIDLTEAEFRQISDLVYDYCRINLHDGKKELVRARIAKQLRAGGYSSAVEYIQRVESDPTGRELVLLIDSVTTNLTSFFRESGHFNFLTTKHLPGLMTKKRATRELRLRAWSAGCSSGEEPYTLSMVLNKILEGQGAWDTKILATDISSRVLEIAKNGLYSETRLRDVPPDMLRQFFTLEPRGKQQADKTKLYRVGPALRSLLTFRRLNLMDEPWPFNGRFDFIFCRNVMIYFDKPTQQKLVQRYWDALEPGGLLFTGHSESLTGIQHKFRYVEPTIYAKP
jgi:chemotaxis protein methyltransferase CheR